MNLNVVWANNTTSVHQAKMLMTMFILEEQLIREPDIQQHDDQRYSCPTGRARPDPARARSGPARLARITSRAGPGRPTCPALCTSTARGPVWRAGPARYARRASWAVPARARLGICTRLPLSQLRMISRFQI